MGWFVDNTLRALEEKSFDASVLRAGCDAGIRIRFEPGKMSIKGLPGGLPLYVELAEDGIHASWDGEHFDEWHEGEEAAVYMFRMLDPRVYRQSIEAERLSQLSRSRTTAKYTYEVARLLESLKHVPQELKDELQAAMGEEREISFDVDVYGEGQRLRSVSQRDLYPLEEEVSVVIR